MYAVTINDFVGASHVSLYQSGIEDICSIFSVPDTIITHYVYGLHTEFSPPPSSFTNILNIELYQIRTKTIQYFDWAIKEFNPEMVIIYSSQPAYTDLAGKKEWNMVLEHIEESWDYIIAGFKPHKHYGDHTFMVDPWGFGSDISEGNTFIIAFDKDRYMDFSREIREYVLPKRPMLHKFHKPLSDYMILPLNGQQAASYYLTRKQYNHLHTKNAKYEIINNQSMIPSLTPSEMLDKDEYYLIQDDAWQVQQLNPDHKINAEGFRFPTPHFYAKVKGYVGYCGLLDNGTDYYHCPLDSYPPGIMDPYRYAYSIDMHAMMYIIKKYVKILRELNRRL